MAARQFLKLQATPSLLARLINKHSNELFDRTFEVLEQRNHRTDVNLKSHRSKSFELRCKRRCFVRLVLWLGRPLRVRRGCGWSWSWGNGVGRVRWWLGLADGLGCRRLRDGADLQVKGIEDGRSGRFVEHTGGGGTNTRLLLKRPDRSGGQWSVQPSMTADGSCIHQPILDEHMLQLSNPRSVRAWSNGRRWQQHPFWHVDRFVEAPDPLEDAAEGRWWTAAHPRDEVFELLRWIFLWRT
mmetsp:Transcript_32443/g.84943  ORF Transcript_32443/g.84943 Transcript_32443/m.84943 type:complete len:241 (+) Transcript_32443:124-846(+)